MHRHGVDEVAATPAVSPRNSECQALAESELFGVQSRRRTGERHLVSFLGFLCIFDIF